MSTATNSDWSCSEQTTRRRWQKPSGKALSLLSSSNSVSASLCCDGVLRRRAVEPYPCTVTGCPPEFVAKLTSDPWDCRKAEEDQVRLRSEAEAPWRSLRLVLYGFSMVSSGLGTLISLPQLIGAVREAPGALETNSVLQNIGINIAVFAVFGFLLRGDLQARDKQMARLTREEKLGSLRIKLANKKVQSAPWICTVCGGVIRR